MKTWDKALAQTWLDKDAYVRAIDQWVGNTLAQHRAVDGEARLKVRLDLAVAQ